MHLRAYSVRIIPSWRERAGASHLTIRSLARRSLTERVSRSLLSIRKRFSLSLSPVRLTRYCRRRLFTVLPSHRKHKHTAKKIKNLLSSHTTNTPKDILFLHTILFNVPTIFQVNQIKTLLPSSPVILETRHRTHFSREPSLIRSSRHRCRRRHHHRLPIYSNDDGIFRHMSISICTSER